MRKDFDIKPVLTSFNNPQVNAPVERLHQVILNMLVTKDIDNKVFDHTYPWVETQVYIAWVIRSPYHRTIMATLGQAVFGRDMFFNLASIMDWRVVTAEKKCQLVIDNVRVNSRQVTYDYIICDQVYVEMTGIYQKLDYKRQGPYRITEVFKNGTFQVQRGQVNERINIIWLKPHFGK